MRVQSQSNRILAILYLCCPILIINFVYIKVHDKPLTFWIAANKDIGTKCILLINHTALSRK